VPRFLLFGLIVICLCAVEVRAQTPADSLLHVAQTAYDNGDFEAAEFAARRGLDAVENLDELARLPFYKMLGFTFVARDQDSTAYKWFLKVVRANPDYEPDPVQTSPKILAVFHKAKKDYLQYWIFYQPQADVRLAASWRSLVLPGWGQYYKQQQMKGAALASAQLLSLVALIAMQSEVNRRHNDYLSKKTYGDPNIETAYGEYRRAYHTRNAVGYVTLGIYVINYLDALYTPVKQRK
jgi:hypothetical protein